MPHLYCSNNQLTALDVSKNTALTQLWCSANRLTALDVSKNTALTYLDCYGNQLTALDVSNNTALTGLQCSGNQLTALDVSKNTNLIHLYCSNNQLTTLDVSKNTALTQLGCSGNQITTLDLSKNTALTRLVCDFTITSADNTFEFNIADFMKAYKSLDNGLSSVDFRYYYDSEYSNLTLDSEQIAANNVVSFTIPEGKTFRYIGMTLTYSNSSNKYVYVYPSGSSPDTTDLDNPYDPDNPDSSNIAPIITTSSLPFASVDVPYSATLSALGSTPITWTLASGDLPTGLTLSSSGTISGTPTTPGASSFTVTATNSAGSTSRLFTIIIPLTAHRSPKITTDFLNTAYTNSPYGFKLTASGTTPLTWSLAQGSSLPDGLTLTTSGYIYGTPISADTTAFTVYVSNSAGAASKDFSLTVSEYPTRTRPAVMTEDPYPATQGEEYICQLVALGTPPFTWTAKKKLPKGLNMTPSGLITGTPTKAKAAKILFTVSNDYGKEDRTLTLNVCKLPEITTKALKDAKVGKKYREIIESSGSKPLTWELEGYLPQGITLFKADKAKLIGTPSTNDSGMVRVTLSNPVGEVSKVFTLKVNAILPKISPKSLKAGKYGKTYNKTIKVKGTEPITLLLSGDLPEGLSFDSSTGKITGTPSEVCTDRKITAIAYNVAGVVSVDYSLTIKAIAPKITTKKLPDAAQGSTYSFDVEATGTPEITWSATGLPSGLSMNSNGTISGTPTQSGKFKVRISAANSAKTAKKSYKLVVTASTAQTTVSTQKSGNSHQTAETITSETGYIMQNTSRNVSAINHVEVNDDVFAGGYSIVAELGTVSVDEAGMYDFTVTLSDDVSAGKELLYLAGSNEPSDDDTIAEFVDDTGKEISAVPENRNVTVSVWLKKGIIYTPSLAVRH